MRKDEERDDSLHGGLGCTHSVNMYRAADVSEETKMPTSCPSRSAQILEEAEDLVVVALVEFLEVAEVLLEHHLAGVGVEDREVDVEHEPGRLDEHLAGRTCVRRRRGVLLGAVSRLVVDVEVDDAGDDEVAPVRAPISFQ
jgi:hypothetical protein